MTHATYTKLEAATEHLDMAIQTTLGGTHGLCAATLANAAATVADDLCQHAKIRRFADAADATFLGDPPPRPWKDYRTMSREGPNAAKHANKAKENTPDASFEISDTNTQGVICGAVLDLRNFRPMTNGELAFFVWMMAKARENRSIRAETKAPFAWAMPSIEHDDCETQLARGADFWKKCTQGDPGDQFAALMFLIGKQTPPVAQA